MNQVVQDILVNVDSSDLLLSTTDERQHTFFEIVWGGLFDDDDPSILYANIIIPHQKVSDLTADDQGRFLIYAHASYCPEVRTFRVRLVQEINGAYAKISSTLCEYPINSVAYYPGPDSETIKASELPTINLDGSYLFDLQFSTSHNKAYIYTSEHTDFIVGNSELQSVQLLSICEPGTFYRYPTTGIGTINFIGSVVSHTDLGQRIIEQFQNDGVKVQDADFNSLTGELKVLSFQGQPEEDTGLLSVDELDIDSLDITDEQLSDIASKIDLDDYDIDYSQLTFDVKLPIRLIESCFANGIWIGEYYWTGALLWQGNR